MCPCAVWWYLLQEHFLPTSEVESRPACQGAPVARTPGVTETEVCLTSVGRVLLLGPCPVPSSSEVRVGPRLEFQSRPQSYPRSFVSVVGGWGGGGGGGGSRVDTTCPRRCGWRTGRRRSLVTGAGDEDSSESRLICDSQPLTREDRSFVLKRTKESLHEVFLISQPQVSFETAGVPPFRVLRDHLGVEDYDAFSMIVYLVFSGYRGPGSETFVTGRDSCTPSADIHKVDTEVEGSTLGYGRRR